MNKEFETVAAEPVQNTLLTMLIDELTRGMCLITSIDDITYCRTANGTGSVGGQFRHNLDFAGCLLNGVKNGLIDYNDRERDIRVETDRQYAAMRFASVMRRLSELNPRIMGKSLLVRSEVDNCMWLPSSFAREVEFVHSHTVHHHALIAEKLAGFGVKIVENFGVAPSTLKFWERRAA